MVGGAIMKLAATVLILAALAVPGAAHAQSFGSNSYDPFTPTTVYDATGMPAGTVSVHVSEAPDVVELQSNLVVVGAEPKRAYRSGLPEPVMVTLKVVPASTLSIIA